MIMGFAHLAVNVADMASAETSWQAEGYTRTALYCDVPNHPSKRVFLSNYQPFHDLLLMTGPGLWPIELTFHGPIQGDNTQLVWGREAIQITLAASLPLRHLLVSGLGFREIDSDDLILTSHLPGWSCRLKLKTGDTLPTYLSASGPTCLAFYSNHIDVDAKRLIELGATDYTGGFKHTLGERDMTIAILRAPGGPILELISPRNRA